MIYGITRKIYVCRPEPYPMVHMIIPIPYGQHNYLVGYGVKCAFKLFRASFSHEAVMTFFELNSTDSPMQKQ